MYRYKKNENLPYDGIIDTTWDELLGFSREQFDERMELQHEQREREQQQ